MRSHRRANDTLIEALRVATREAHSRVDALFGASDFTADAGYIRFLTAQGAAWETLRPILSEASRGRADALREDMAALGQAVPQALPHTGLPSSDSIGLRYVLEGSRLGSTVLLRRLEDNGSKAALTASNYLRRSADVGPWKQLSTLLQTDCDGVDRIAGINKDALFVFGLFESAWRATDSA